MKHFLPFFATLLFSASLILTATAQSSGIADSNKNKDAKLDYVIMQAASSSAHETYISVINRDTIPACAVKNFERSFIGIDNVRWEKTAEGSYLAGFINDNKTALVVYNHNGEWMHTIYNYGADQLNQNIKTKIINAYGEYKISYVDEVNTAGSTVYLVHIESETNIKTIKFCDNKMGEIQTLCKK
jgi:hypothetical protein